MESTFEEFNGPSLLVELYNREGQKLYSSTDPAEPIQVRLPFLAFSKANALEPPTVIFDLHMNKNRKYSFREKTMWEVEKAVGGLYGEGIVKSFYGNPSDKQTIYSLILDEKGEILARGNQFTEDLIIWDMDIKTTINDYQNTSNS